MFAIARCHGNPSRDPQGGLARGLDRDNAHLIWTSTADPLIAGATSPLQYGRLCTLLKHEAPVAIGLSRCHAAGTSHRIIEVFV